MSWRLEIGSESLEEQLKDMTEEAEAVRIDSND